jgi:hypothetical protein
MNKYLVMTAAALAAASAAAATDANAKGSSGTATVTFNTPSGYYTYCDLVHLGWNGAASAQSDDLNTYCYFGFASHGAGAIGKIKGVGKTMINGDDQITVETGGYSVEGLAFEYSFPIVQGGASNLYLSTTCCSSFLINSTTYNVLGPAHAKPAKKGVGLVKSLISSGKIKVKKPPYGPINPF